jgi:hypothetical protein
MLRWSRRPVLRSRALNNVAVAAIMLVFVIGPARAELRLPTPAAKSAFSSTQSLASANHLVVATVLVTLPPEEKPKTHWPWWLRILAVVGVLVFIRLVAGSVRNKPGTPGPS